MVENGISGITSNPAIFQKALSNEDSYDEEILPSLTPEDQFQQAFDLLRNQRFDEAKTSFLMFIEDNNENILSGTAHYWLGEIYLLKKEYREAALILAEGYQKFPNSIKSSIDMTCC